MRELAFWCLVLSVSIPVGCLIYMWLFEDKEARADQLLGDSMVLIGTAIMILLITYIVM